MMTSKGRVELSHREGVSDDARARELYKYYQPSTQIDSPISEAIEWDRDLNINSDVTSSKISSPDTALTVFCQLTAWRTGCQRAMISLIDAETQYFVAESTRSLDLVDNRMHAPGDGLWLGCSSVSKSGRLCERYVERITSYVYPRSKRHRTIAVAATEDQSYPHFIVNDLSKDERFNKLPFVTDFPYLRRYIGVPLITKRGIPIGSLFVVDDRPGNGLNKKKLSFLGTMAKTVMRHFELVREVEEHRRGMKMSHGLSSFVEGRGDLFEVDVEKSDAEDTSLAEDIETTRTNCPTVPKESVLNTGPKRVKVTSNSADSQEKTVFNVGKKLKLGINHDLPEKNLFQIEQSKSFHKKSAEAGSSRIVSLPVPERMNTSLENDSEDVSIRDLFSRAAHLIQLAFELDGGTVFYDARTGSSESINDSKTNSTSCQPRDNSQFGSEFSSSEGESELPFKQKPRDTTIPNLNYHKKPRDSFYSKSNTAMNKPADILGYSTSEYSSIQGNTFPGNHIFKPVRHKALQSLLRQYPRGKLWAFNADGIDLSSEKNPKSVPTKSDRLKTTDQSRTRPSAKFLSRHFPGVQQLLFIPLWDAGRSRWFGGCFTWSKEPTRILSKQSELSFLTAFGNCVMAEWARIDTEIADQKKSDFIGSISHELRSPLHGILASVEFLEEVLNGWEKQLVETIESCGRTLLDTIINHFESHWRRSRRAKFRAGFPVGLEQSDLPMLNLFQDIDISVICEEVIDSVYAGHVFQNCTAQSFDQVSDTQGKMFDAQHSLSSADPVMGLRKFQGGVVVVLDIDPKNYHVTTQPGALRRLIMNLLGNSLKYTSHGYVIIRLDCREMEGLVTTGPNSTEEIIPRSVLTFTITDTGKGISPEFLRNKLFIPFAQENILSSGTGLGLSIVRAIVSLLEGEITIDSEVGRGTQVRVSIPVLRRMPQNPTFSEEAYKSVVKQPPGIHKSVIHLRTRIAGKKASLFGFDVNSEDSILNEQNRVVKASIINYLTNWYHMEVLPFEEKVDFIIANESNQSVITSIAHKNVEMHGNYPSIIILCCQTSVLDRIHTIDGTQCKIGYTAKPIGPIKLAKAITQTIDGSSTIMIDRSELKISKTNDLDGSLRKLSIDSQNKASIDTNSKFSRESIENTLNSATEHKSEPHDPTSLKSDNKPTVKNDFVIIPQKLQELKPITPSPKLRLPSILLVDDNQINLRLLSTYLGRRAYPRIDTAQNGLEAVQKFEALSCGYDIIFMDITMPVLDGFGATRQIRGIEKKISSSDEMSVDRKVLAVPTEKKRRSALIIAFTGRSSTEDQNEAMRCGIDLFMTKPVPFREVGKICDNWIINQIQKDATTPS